MKLKRTFRIFVLLLTTSVFCFTSCNDDLCTEPTLDDNQELTLKSGHIRTVPFNAQYTTYPNILDDTGGILVVDIPGTGTASHLGASTWYSKAIMNATTAPPWIQTGPMEFVHKNRPDTLFGFYNGLATPLIENSLQGWGDFVIINGTGKFKGVTGSGTYEFLVSNENIGDLNFTGVLDFPKKEKPDHRRSSR